MNSIRLKGQGGQATIEYVLLLVVTVSLLLALMTQVFTPLQKFLQAYMGSYVQCLLEYGELPALSGEPGDASECNVRFAEFSLLAGRPPVNGSGSGSESGDGSSSSSGDESGDGSSRGGSRASAGSGGSGRSRLVTSGRATPGADGAGEQKVIEIEVSSAGAGKGTFMSRSSAVTSSSERRQPVVIDSTQISEIDRKKVERQKKQAERAQASISEATEPRAPTRFAVEPPPAPKMDDLNEEEFSFGSFIRMLVIIGIILAIVVFVGGQVFQMSKNSSD